MTKKKTVRLLVKQIRTLPKRFWSLTPWTIFFTVLVLTFCVEAGALVIQHGHTRPATTADTSTNVASGNFSDSTVRDNTIVPSPTSTTPQRSQAPDSATNCSSIESDIEQNYNSTLSAAWSAWSDETAKYTPAEINYEYNQSAQSVYNQESQAIDSDGCTSHLTLALKYPATNPYDSAVATPAPSVPTCNTSLETSYENSYESQYQELLEQESEEIQSTRAELSADGAADGSAWDEVPTLVAEQFSGKFSTIKNTLNYELASIDCSGD